MLPALALAAVLSSAASADKFSLEPPPGWEDVTAARAGAEVVVALKGPETSSFVLAKIAPMSLDNRGAVRAFLIDVLSSVNQKTGLSFTLASNLNSTTYDNGVTLHSINADYQGKPRLVLGVLQAGEETLLATLISSVPETLLPSIMGGLRGAKPPAAKAGAQAGTLDGQLAFDLPEGLATRPVTEAERKMGFVLALQGYGSELMVMKLTDDSTPVAEQPAVVRDTVLSVGGVDKASLSELALLPTAAGPQLVYASAKVGGGSQFSAGYLPWCYWGYSVLSKGPRAQDLMRDAFGAVKLGGSAIPKLVQETPKIPLSSELKIRGKEIPVGPAAAAVLVLLALVFLLARKKK